MSNITEHAAEILLILLLFLLRVYTCENHWVVTCVKRLGLQQIYPAAAPADGRIIQAETITISGPNALSSDALAIAPAPSEKKKKEKENVQNVFFSFQKKKK